MCRHSRNRQELIKRIRDGELGDIHLIRAYRMEARRAAWARGRRSEKELFWQIRNFISFFWVSGGLWAEMDIHQIDELCWLKDAWPVSAHGIGGRAANSTDCSQNLDSFSAEWTFADGAKGYDVVRYLPNCYNEFATYVHGTKCAAQFSGYIHAGTVHIYKDQRIAADNIAWKAREGEVARPGRPSGTSCSTPSATTGPTTRRKRAALSNLADMMGRAAIHSGKIITWDEAMASNFQWCPQHRRDERKQPPADPGRRPGRYPVPMPGSVDGNVGVPRHAIYQRLEGIA